MLGRLTVDTWLTLNHYQQQHAVHCHRNQEFLLDTATTHDIKHRSDDVYQNTVTSV